MEHGERSADEQETGREQAAESDSPRFARLRAIRAWIYERPHLHLIYKILVGTVGAIVVIGGLILVPLPGPGWLIVFIGLAILASEFQFFHRIITWLQARLHRFWDWAKAKAPSQRLRAAAARGKAGVDDAHAESTRPF